MLSFKGTRQQRIDKEKIALERERVALYREKIQLERARIERDLAATPTKHPRGSNLSESSLPPPPGLPSQSKPPKPPLPSLPPAPKPRLTPRQDETRRGSNESNLSGFSAFSNFSSLSSVSSTSATKNRPAPPLPMKKSSTEEFIEEEMLLEEVEAVKTSFKLRPRTPGSSHGSFRRLPALTSSAEAIRTGDNEFLKRIRVEAAHDGEGETEEMKTVTIVLKVPKNFQCVVHEED